jgi:hypothetical protein
MTQPDDAGVPAETVREDEDDYDLLTFGEAGVRLDTEIRALAGEVALLEAAGLEAAGLEAAGKEPAQLAKARERLAQLRDAAARNSRQPITDENFARFFGYEGKARRNTK